MASLSTSATGLREIIVVVGGQRKKIRLGRITKKQAESILRKVEHLSACKTSGASIDGDLAAWLGSLPDQDTLLRRLVTLGLTGARKRTERGHTLKQLVDKFVAMKEPTLAPRSTEKLKGSLVNLTEFLGEDCIIESVTVASASEFESAMFTSGASLAHVRTLNRYAKQVLEFACDLEWIAVNPCRKLKSTAVASSVRHYVTPVDAMKLIASALPGPTRLWE